MLLGSEALFKGLADGRKLIVKEVLLPTKSEKVIFLLAPVLSFTLGIAGWVVAPIDIFANVNFLDSTLSILVVLALSSIGVYGIVLSGWSSNSKYAFLGGIRSSAQIISYEIFFGTIILAVVVLAGSLSLKEIVKSQISSVWYLLPRFPIAISFYIAMLAETNRAPFDLPEAEAEIVAGYNIEYASMTFALFFLGEYGAMYFLSAMWVYLFMGGWSAPIGLLSFVPVSIWFILKVSIINFLYIFVRANFPRYRYDQLMSIGWKLFLPYTFAYLVLVICIVMGGDSSYFNPTSITSFDITQLSKQIF